VLPVSDDGGSTAEIVRVLGGPAVGDIRSRCLRLADDSDPEVRGASSSRKAAATAAAAAAAAGGSSSTEGTAAERETGGSREGAKPVRMV
jgi:hypothetical protein